MACQDRGTPDSLFDPKTRKRETAEDDRFLASGAAGRFSSDSRAASKRRWSNRAGSPSTSQRPSSRESTATISCPGEVHLPQYDQLIADFNRQSIREAFASAQKEGSFSLIALSSRQSALLYVDRFGNPNDFQAASTSSKKVRLFQSRSLPHYRKSKGYMPHSRKNPQTAAAIASATNWLRDSLRAAAAMAAARCKSGLMRTLNVPL